MKKYIYLLAILPIISMGYNINSTVWNDANQDWEQNLNEKGFENVSVELYDNANKKLKTTTSNAEGKYTFPNLEEGEYVVKVVPPTGVEVVTLNNIELWLESDRDDINFGLYKKVSYSIGDTIWNDKNENWTQDASEKGLANVSVELYQNGTKVQTTKSNAQGKYKFLNVEEGEYVVKVIASANTKVVTENNLELWVESDRVDIDFGMLEDDVINPNLPINRATLSAMIRNHEDVTQVNTSEITDMSNLFRLKPSFNQDISAWDVSKVTNMRNMFINSDAFNQDLSSWDVSKVRDMEHMFENTKVFNADLSGWRPLSVTSMYQMFKDAKAFNQPIGDWDVHSVLNMQEMFHDARIFNQNLNNWNTASLDNMYGMFWNAYAYNQPMDNWNTSNVEFMTKVFYNAKSFNQPIGSWDVSNVDTMESMFDGAVVFNQSIGSWDVSWVKSMKSMFAHINYNQPLNSWDVSSVENMRAMFVFNEAFNQPLNNWNVSLVTNMRAMFANTKEFNQDISNWNVDNVSLWTSIFFRNLKIQEDNKPPKFR